MSALSPDQLARVSGMADFRAKEHMPLSASLVLGSFLCIEAQAKIERLEGLLLLIAGRLRTIGFDGSAEAISDYLESEV